MRQIDKLNDECTRLILTAVRESANLTRCARPEPMAFALLQIAELQTGQPGAGSDLANSEVWRAHGKGALIAARQIGQDLREAGDDSAAIDLEIWAQHLTNAFWAKAEIYRQAAILGAAS